MTKFSQKIIAIKDKYPKAPVHLLVIPKIKGNLDMLSNATKEDSELLGYMLYQCSQIAKRANLDNGFRLVINNGPDGGKLKRADHLPLAHAHYGRHQYAVR